jgi:hypothetical protein
VIIFLHTRSDQKGRQLRDNEESADDVFISIRKFSLGKLIDIAESYNVFNEGDIEYLRSVTPKRNDVAHTFFRDAYLERRFGNRGEEKKMLRELKDIEAEFKGLNKAIMKIVSDYEKKGARK